MFTITVVVYGTLASLLLTIVGVTKIKKETEMLRKDIETLKKQIK